MLSIFKSKTPVEQSIPVAPGLLLPFDSLTKLAKEKHSRYVGAQPFPHVILDNFLPNSVLQQVISEFPPPDAPLQWRKHYVQTADTKLAQANKLGFSDETQLKPTLRQLFWELNCARFLTFLQELTGINNLISDPHMMGGGIHQSLPGAVLRVHADFSHHPEWNLSRRLNLIIYLNENWKDEYAGHLELWSPDMKRCAERVTPVANRCVIFSTNRTSFHGHPQPLKCPEGMTRKSLALYYYTNGRPEEEGSEAHGTLWQNLPDER